MEKINVLVAMPFPDELIQKLADVSPDLAITRREARSAEDIQDIIGEMDVLYGWQGYPQPDDAPRLRWVQLHSAGIDHILEHPLYAQTEIMFTTTSGIHAIQMAEYVFAMILALAHRVPRMVEDQSAIHWPEDRWGRYVPVELFGSSIGIVGYGSIGRQIARLADAFGMRVLATKRNTRSLHHEGFSIPDTGDPEAEIPERIYPPEALHSFLAECDYVVITTPLTSQTHHLIDESALGAMKHNAILVNVSRGDVVDESALVKAIEGNKIGGAALDVYSQEPLPPESPLWKLPNVLLSPHVSGFSDHYDRRAVEVFAENLRRFLNEEPLLNLVERGRDY